MCRFVLAAFVLTVRRSTILTGVVVVALCGCGDGTTDPTDGEQEPAVMMPLEVGNTWRYSVADTTVVNAPSSGVDSTTFVGERFLYVGQKVELGGRWATRVVFHDFNDTPSRWRPAYTGRMATVMNMLQRGQTGRALVEAITWQRQQPGNVLALVALGEALVKVGARTLAPAISMQLIEYQER